MAKIQRKFLAHYINAAPLGSDAPSYERLGKDLEEFSPELSAQVDTRKNILGQTEILISGYEKTGAVEPYYAEEGSALFERLQDILDHDRVLDEVATDLVEVKLWKGEAEVFPAIREKVFVEINSYGGDTTGYQIPFTLHFTGEKTHGTFDVKTKTFTPAE